ncbi:MAG: hypothetical protein ACREMV_09865, partial [Gemmatimonadales bacterium]
WAAMLAVGVVASGLAATGTFEKLLGLVVALVLMIDGFAVVALFPLRARAAGAPFRAPLGAVLPAVFVAVYAALLVGILVTAPATVGLAAAVLGMAYLLGRREAGDGRT